MYSIWWKSLFGVGRVSLFLIIVFIKHQSEWVFTTVKTEARSLIWSNSTCKNASNLSWNTGIINNVFILRVEGSYFPFMATTWLRLSGSAASSHLLSWTSWIFSIPMALLRRELKGPDFFLVGLFPGMISDCGDRKTIQKLQIYSTKTWHKLSTADYLCRNKMGTMEMWGESILSTQFQISGRYLKHILWGKLV